MIKLNPLCNQKKPNVKESFDLFLLYLFNRFFSVLEVLYERNCSTKGATHPLQRVFNPVINIAKVFTFLFQ